MQPKEQMRKFINSKGGPVRFDTFAREHLAGFYFRNTNLGNRPEDVTTPTNIDPQYRSSVAKVMVSMTASTAHNRNLGEKDTVSFCEIGGGSGAFKEEFLFLWGEWKQSNRELPLIEYVSVEPNIYNRGAQYAAGRQDRGVQHRAVEGTATKTGLPDKSVDVLFDDEVLDCQPPRIVEYDWKSRGEIKFEYSIKGDSGLSVVRVPVFRDDKLIFFEEHLKGAEKYFGEVAFSPDYWGYWEESRRVLKSGGFRASMDYHVGTPLPPIDNLGLSARMNPYDADLTHMIDFELQEKIIKQMGGFGFIKVYDLTKLIFSLFREFTERTNFRKFIAAVRE